MNTGPEGHRRRGRPRIRRRVSDPGMLRCYGPWCQIPVNTEAVTILPEEIEVLRLVDLEGMEQEEAAAYLGVSRRTVWKDLHDARRKIADALVNGKVIEVGGCIRQGRDGCPWNGFLWKTGNQPSSHPLEDDSDDGSESNS